MLEVFLAFVLNGSIDVVCEVMLHVIHVNFLDFILYNILDIFLDILHQAFAYAELGNKY